MRSRRLCGLLPASREQRVNGDPESPVEFMCEVAHLRALTLGFEIPEHGDCEFCTEPERQAALMESVRRITSHEITPVAWTEPQSILPILNNSQGATGCGGCGSFH